MVVSTRLVVILAAVTVAVAFAFTSVPVGFHPLTVSILTERLTDGDTNFLNESFNVLLATPLPNHTIATLVFAVTSPMFCSTVDSAKVGRLSTNKLSFARIVSQAMYWSFSNRASGADAHTILALNQSVTVFSSAGHTTSLAQVSPTLVPDVTCAGLDISTTHFAVSLAFGGGVPISKSSRCAVALL